MHEVALVTGIDEYPGVHPQGGPLFGFRHGTAQLVEGGVIKYRGGNIRSPHLARYDAMIKDDRNCVLVEDFLKIAAHRPRANPDCMRGRVAGAVPIWRSQLQEPLACQTSGHLVFRAVLQGLEPRTEDAAHPATWLHNEHRAAFLLCRHGRGNARRRRAIHAHVHAPGFGGVGG